MRTGTVLLGVAAAALGLLALASKAFAKGGEPGGAPGVRQQKVKGESGIEWIERWPEDNPKSFVVWAPKGAFGPHEDMPVARINLETNTAEAWPGAPEVAYQAVEADFHITLTR